MARSAMLVLAPLAGDAAAIAREGEACGLAARAVADAAALDTALREAPPETVALVVLAEEGAGEAAGRALAATADAEPPLSAVPALFLVEDARRPPPAVHAVMGDGREPPCLTLERPVRPPVLRDALATLAETRRRQVETRELLDRLAESERRQRFLLSELRHRTANSFAVLRAVFSLSARRAASLGDLETSFTARLDTLARAHAALSAEGSVEGRPLEALVREHAEPYAPAPDRLACRGPAVRLASKAAFELSLVIHELATNAAKHGALSVETGRVEVAWSVEPDAALSIAWRERGGPTVAPPSRRGLGSTVIAGFSVEGASAEIDFAPEGLVWTARLPPACLNESGSLSGRG